MAGIEMSQQQVSETHLEKIKQQNDDHIFIEKHINVYKDIKETNVDLIDEDDDSSADFKMTWNGVTKTIFEQHPELNRTEYKKSPKSTRR